MRRLIANITVLMLTILVSSCTKDDFISQLPSAEEAVLRFTLPNSSLVDIETKTRTEKNDFEKKITNMDLFLIEVKAEGETAPAANAAVIEHYTTFSNNAGAISIIIPTRDEPCWVVAVVNASEAELNVTTFADIKGLSENLTSLYSTVGTSYAGKLPMYGQKYFDKIIAGDNTLGLAHICARIDVTSTAEDYTLESATLLNGANIGHYVPQNPLTEYKDNDVTEYETITMSGSNMPSIYLYENGGGASSPKNYTDIIIGGKYTLSPNNVVDSYIKIKLEYGSPLTADILRNTLYKVTLKSINKSNIGYKTLEEAKQGEYSDAEIDIEIDTDALGDLVVGNGDYYMSFSNSEYRAYIPTGTKNDLTAFTLHFNKNSNSEVNIANVSKEISLGAGSIGITLVDGDGSKTSTWTAGTDIDVKVNLEDNATGSLIVRIGNLVKEIKVFREQNASNLPTAFNDDNYIYAKFVNEAPSWLKIAPKGETPDIKNELYSANGFTLKFEKDAKASQSTELYLSRSAEKGPAKVYVEQYQISNSEFDVSGLSNNTSISYDGADITTSFAVTASSANFIFLDNTTGEVNIYWEAEFSHDNGATWTTTKPAWIDMPTSGDGILAECAIKASAQPLTGLTGEAATAQAVLRAAAPLGSTASPYNLANSSGGTVNQNTANCYIVGAAGTYKLPLVYGNAIKNSSTNSAAYSGATFVGYNGSAITQPNISGAASAVLCWQDAPNLVTGVQLSGDYLVFTVPQGTITEGNAVVAIRDASNKIMWSWHIWVTNYKKTSDKIVYYQATYTDNSNNYSTMMNVNLGWCSSGTWQYGEGARTVKVRLKQAGGAVQPSPEGVTYTQNAGQIASMGNSPFYQYGRKDPMLPGNGTGNTDKVQSGNLLWKTADGPTSLANAIQNPNSFYTVSSGDWCSATYDKLWSARNSTNSIHIANHVKTVYDPSPIGYVVPPDSYFSGFTTTGAGTTSLSQFNVSGSFNYGWNFYCGLNKTGVTIFFPASGYRGHITGSLSSLNVNGVYWSASPANSNAGYSLNFTNYYLYSSYNNTRPHGFSVRPVQE